MSSQEDKIFGYKFDKEIKVQKIFNVVRVEQEPRDLEMRQEKTKKKTACDPQIHAEQLRESEEYTEYLSTLRRINARGNTDTESYLNIWGSLLKKVH